MRDKFWFKVSFKSECMKYSYMWIVHEIWGDEDRRS